MSHAMNWQHACAWAKRLQDASIRKGYRVYDRVIEAREILRLMGDCRDQPEAIIAARAQKAALLITKNRLAEDPSFNQRYVAKTGLGWLDKLLTVARLKELSTVKIVKAGKSTGLRYNIMELRRTFYGLQIMKSLGFSKQRSSLNAEEFARLEAACAKIKLTLPRSVEPTTTERFFNDNEESKG